jgi:hypothetical protein
MSGHINKPRRFRPSKRFICPCKRCPACHAWQHRLKDEHPEDGLAYCHSCECPEPSPRVVEWWVSTGPHMDGRHPKSAEELKEWNDCDDAVWRGEA